MKALPSVMLALGAAFVGANCSTYMTVTESPPAKADASSAWAVDRIVTARCERARRCASPSVAKAVADTCLFDERRDVEQNFADNKHCVNGVSSANLDHCLSNIASEGCSTEDVETGWSCRSRQICVR
jgi:hypothetical protein